MGVPSRYLRYVPLHDIYATYLCCTYYVPLFRNALFVNRHHAILTLSTVDTGQYPSSVSRSNLTKSAEKKVLFALFTPCISRRRTNKWNDHVCLLNRRRRNDVLLRFPFLLSIPDVWPYLSVCGRMLPFRLALWLGR